MTIREAAPADAEQIIAHIQRVASEPERTILLGPGEFTLTAAQEREVLSEYGAADNAVSLVVEVDGGIVAVLSCSGGKRQATRHSASFGMSVAQEWRNKGVGTALLGRLVEWAEDSGIIRRLDLEVWAHNAAALHLYRKFGFVEEGRRREAYFLNGRFVDGILMARRLQLSGAGACPSRTVRRPEQSEAEGHVRPPAPKLPGDEE